MAGTVGYITGRNYIWTETNPCGSCNREMHRVGFPEKGKVCYHAKGLCSRCYQSKPPLILVAQDIPDGYKLCIRCDQILNCEYEFSINKSTSSGRSPWCKKCTTLNKFGMTRNDFDAMVTLQQGVCRICSEDPTDVGHVLVVDHDRSCCKTTSSCGQCIRGLLCPRCNSGLGFFRDSMDYLDNAINYLKETSCQ